VILLQFDKSLSLYERAKSSLAGGVSSHFRVGGHPCPLFFERGEGSRLFDVDGNEYIDYALGQGPMILGHSPKPVIEAVEAASSKGQLFAGQHELEVIVAEKVQEFVPCAELMRFSNAGSEAIQAALRLARGYTGKTKYLKFEGHYHGWFDNVLLSVAPPLDKAGPRESPRTLPGSQGQVAACTEEAIALPWNDLELLEKTVVANKDDLAAVVMEPIMCNTNCIEPEPGFLEGVREVCTREGMVLVFDEIITGFRPCLGGAQAHFGVVPDLATFGKAMANGYPVSMLAGQEEFMRLIADGAVMHAGTYNSNVMVMAATNATLNCLAESNGAVYAHLEALGRHLMDGLRDAAASAGHSVLVQGLGPMFHMGFTAAERITDYRTHASSVDMAKYARFVALMLERGIRLIGRGIWYVSAAHTQQDMTRTLDAASESLRTLI